MVPYGDCCWVTPPSAPSCLAYSSSLHSLLYLLLKLLISSLSTESHHTLTRCCQHSALSSLLSHVRSHNTGAPQHSPTSNVSINKCNMDAAFLAGVSGATVVTQKPPVLTATKGEKTTMHCNLGSVTDYQAVWYKQVPGEATLYVISNYHGWSSPQYGSGFSSPKFTSTHSSQSDYTLIISNVEVGDSAVYYCETYDSSASEFVSQWFTPWQKPPHCSHSLLLSDNTGTQPQPLVWELNNI